MLNRMLPWGIVVGPRRSSTAGDSGRVALSPCHRRRSIPVACCATPRGSRSAPPSARL